MEWLSVHQLNIMQALSGICGIMACLLFVTKALSVKRRWILIASELTSMLLVSFDRLAYIYSGDISRTGYIMVRVSNFIVFFMTSGIVLIFNLYLTDIIKNECEEDSIPVRLKVVQIMALTGMLLIIISQFTGLIYAFDDNNRYHRAPLFILCYIIPVAGPLIQLSVIIQYRNKIRHYIYTSLVLFLVVPIAAALIQIFVYGLSLVNIAMVIVAVFMYIYAYLDINETIERAHKLELEGLKEKHRNIRKVFDQTATSFVNAIDARNADTRGHSVRVAGYAKQMAIAAGKDEEECDRIYYEALLHDVGKLGVPDSILNKNTELTKEEEEIIKQQPEMGNHILSGITELPYLVNGAHYHMERYDGSGYPDKLKGKEIPEEARIIAVADSYDALTCKTTTRNPLPQPIVREEFVKGSGSKYDPKYASIMLKLIDDDKSYQMNGSEEGVDVAWQNGFHCEEYRSNVSYGIHINPTYTHISFRAEPDEGFREEWSVPSLLLFDSHDARVHDIARNIADTHYMEYGEVWFDGHIVCTSARDMKISPVKDSEPLQRGIYIVEMARYRDHARILLRSSDTSYELTVALPDSTRAAYVALTGEHCSISDISIEETDKKIKEEEIERIVDEISYIDRLTSDIPNVQVDSHRSAATKGIRIDKDVTIRFHAMSLPTASLVWHCAFIVLFTSDDGEADGPGYREFAAIRLDGEEVSDSADAVNDCIAVKGDDFPGWDKWKEIQKKGVVLTVKIARRGGKITLNTEDAGITIKNVTTIDKKVKDVYAVLTGDQCALTDIRIKLGS